MCSVLSVLGCFQIDVQRQRWQKIEICLREKIDVVFEDDEKVIAIFRRFAPKIRVMQVHLNGSDE